METQVEAYKTDVEELYKSSKSIVIIQIEKEQKEQKYSAKDKLIRKLKKKVEQLEEELEEKDENIQDIYTRISNRRDKCRHCTRNYEINAGDGNPLFLANIDEIQNDLKIIPDVRYLFNYTY